MPLHPADQTPLSNNRPESASCAGARRCTPKETKISNPGGSGFLYSRRHVCRLARLLACSKYLWLGHEARVFAYHFGRRPAVLGATCRLLGEVQAPNWVGEAPDYGALTPITVALARHKSEGCLRCVVSGSNDCYLDVLALACPASRWPWARSPLNDTGCRPGWRSHCDLNGGSMAV